MGLLHVPTQSELRRCVEAGQSLRQMGCAFEALIPLPRRRVQIVRVTAFR